MNITRQVKLEIISDAADIIESRELAHCCNALSRAARNRCEGLLTYDEGLLTYDEVNILIDDFQKEFWNCLMIVDTKEDYCATLESRLSSLNGELYPSCFENIEMRLQMLALYYELVRRGHTFKDFRHVT